MAADFKRREAIPFPLVVDRTKETYRMLDISRATGWNVYGPPVWLKGIQSMLRGYLNKIPKQDPFQLGGAVVARAGGEVVVVHRAKASHDFYAVSKLLKGFDKAAGSQPP